MVNRFESISGLFDETQMTEPLGVINTIAEVASNQDAVLPVTAGELEGNKFSEFNKNIYPPIATGTHELLQGEKLFDPVTGDFSGFAYYQKQPGPGAYDDFYLLRRPHGKWEITENLSGPNIASTPPDMSDLPQRATSGLTKYLGLLHKSEDVQD